MPDQFPCPHCHRILSQAPELNDMVIACPYCHGQFRMQDRSAPPIPAARPTGVTVVGVLGIIFSALTLLLTTCAAAVFGLASSIPEIQQELQRALEGRQFTFIDHFAMVFACLIALILLIVSIGLLRRSRTARTCFYGLSLLWAASVTTRIAYTATQQGALEALQVLPGAIVGLAYYGIGCIYLAQKRAAYWFAPR